MGVICADGVVVGWGWYGVGPVLGLHSMRLVCLGMAGSGVNWGLHHLGSNQHRRG